VYIYTFNTLLMDTSQKYQKIGDSLRKIREIKGIKQESVAKQLGLTTNGYGKIERGETSLNIKRLEEIAEILGVNALDIMQFDENIIFNINTMSNSAPNGTVNNYSLIKEERRFLADQIKSLNELVEKQNNIIDILMKKL
jgi:transcriptional regulator with XRE-family HTH domain